MQYKRYVQQKPRLNGSVQMNLIHSKPKHCLRQSIQERSLSTELALFGPFI